MHPRHAATDLVSCLSKLLAKHNVDHVLIEGLNNELQQEIEILKEIYLDELHVNADTSGRPYELTIQLQPATGECVDQKWVCLTLQLTLCKEYPAVEPVIRISNPRGLTEQHVISLQRTLLSLAEERRGDPVLYDLIEHAKESLTVGNVPQGQCIVCLEELTQDTISTFTRTACYHYFHSDCLRRYISHSRSELEDQARDNANNRVAMVTADGTESSIKIVCPVCRELLADDSLKDLDSMTVSCVSATDETQFQYVPSSETVQLQQHMSELFRRQLEKGGIIDEEAERNKFLVPKEGLFISLEKVDSTKESTAVGGDDSKTQGSKITAKSSKGHHCSQKYESASREHKDRIQRDKWRRSNREPQRYHNSKAMCTADENGYSNAESTLDVNSSLSIEKHLQSGGEDASTKTWHLSASNDSRPLNRSGKMQTRKPYKEQVRGEHEKERYDAGRNIGSSSRGFSDSECVEGDDVTKSRASRVSRFRDLAENKNDLQFSERSNKYEARDKFHKYDTDETSGIDACDSACDKMDSKVNERSSKFEQSNQFEKQSERRVKSAQHDRSNNRNVPSSYVPHDKKSYSRGTNSNFRHFEPRAGNARHRHFNGNKEKTTDFRSTLPDEETRCLNDAKPEDKVLDRLVKNELIANLTDVRRLESTGSRQQLGRLDLVRQVCKTASDEKSENYNDFAECPVDKVENVVDRLATTSLESVESRKANQTYGRDNRLQGGRHHRASNTSRNYNRNHRPDEKGRSNNQERNNEPDRNGNEERVPWQDALEKSDERQQSMRKKPRDFGNRRPVNDRIDSGKCMSSHDDAKRVASSQARRTDERKLATYPRRTGSVLLPTVPTSHPSDASIDACVGVVVSSVERDSSDAGSFHPPGFLVSSGLQVCALSLSSVPSS